MEKVLEVRAEKDGERRVFSFPLKGFGTIKIGALIVPIRELNFWLQAAYGWEAKSVELKDSENNE